MKLLYKVGVRSRWKYVLYIYNLIPFAHHPWHQISNVNYATVTISNYNTDSGSCLLSNKDLESTLLELAYTKSFISQFSTLVKKKKKLVLLPPTQSTVKALYRQDEK